MARNRRAALEAVLLVGVLGLVGAVAYLPHADAEEHEPPAGPSLYQIGVLYKRIAFGQAADYPYTVHVDENVHWYAAASTERAASLRYEGIFFGSPGGELPLSLKGLVHERGFHVVVVSIHELTGVPFETLFRFLPAVWLAASAALLWATLRPWPGALLAAALVALVPTTARFLGPGFLVPIGFGLAWIVTAMLLLDEVVRRGRAAGLLLLVLTWSFFIHLIIGFAVLLLVACALPFARGHRRGAALLAALALLPVLALSQVFAEDVSAEVKVAEFLPVDFTIFDQVGIPILFLWAAGCATVALRPPERVKLPVQAATAASAVAFAFIVLGLALHLRSYALYDRWHQPFVLLAAVPVAVAIEAIARAAARLPGWVAARVPRWRSRPALPAWVQPASAACIAGLLWVGATDEGLSAHVHTPYYHVLSDSDWAAYTWDAANIRSPYDVFLTHPWKAPILAAMTGKTPYAYLAPGTPPLHGQEYAEYVAGQHPDAAWLVERDVSFVVDPVAPASPFQPTGPLTSQLDPADAQLLAQVRAT